METPRRIRQPQLPVDRLAQQYGPSCQINALFHYIFSSKKKLYRFITNEGWYKIATELMKPVDLTQELVVVNLITESKDWFTPEMEFKNKILYDLLRSDRETKYSDLYEILKGEPDGMVAANYIKTGEEKKVAEEYYNVEFFKFFEEEGGDLAETDFEKIKKVYRWFFKLDDTSPLKSRIFRLFSGHRTTWTNNQMIDSNGYVGSVAPDFSYRDNIILMCQLFYCDMTDDELEKVPVNPELGFLDDVWDGMQRALETKTFKKSIQEKLITPYLQSPHYKKMSRIMGLEPIPMKLVRFKETPTVHEPEDPKEEETPTVHESEDPKEGEPEEKKRSFEEFSGETPKLTAPTPQELMQSLRRRGEQVGETTPRLTAPTPQELRQAFTRSAMKRNLKK